MSPPSVDMGTAHLQSVTQQGAGYELSVAEREELQRLRHDSYANKNKLGEHAKKRVEILADIGRLTRDVTVGGITFSLRTLKNREARETTTSIMKCPNDLDASYELKRQTLARSIFQVDGRDIEEALGGTSFDLKLALVDEMEEVVIIKLYNEFHKMRDDVVSQYGILSEKDVKEVVADVKKS